MENLSMEAIAAMLDSDSRVPAPYTRVQLRKELVRRAKEEGVQEGLLQKRYADFILERATLRKTLLSCSSSAICCTHMTYF